MDVLFKIYINYLSSLAILQKDCYHGNFAIIYK